MKLFSRKQPRTKERFWAFRRKADKKYIQPIKSIRPQQDLAQLNPIRSDLYHWLLILSWGQFLLWVTLFYLGVNIAFAIAYLLPGNLIANATPGSFKDTFFFSIQTLSTVGYGSMYPESLISQLLVTLEIFVGLLAVAILTGLMFARFSRPTAHIIFSKIAVITPFNGIPTLMFRVANRRDNRILEAQIKVTFVRSETSLEGQELRRFYDLKLSRSHTPIFGLSWLVMHPIDSESLLFNKTLEAIEEEKGAVWVSLTGLDETFSQTIHARHSYNTQEICWNKQFVDIFSETPEGKSYINFRNFHEVSDSE